jgi:hypothetical protein
VNTNPEILTGKVCPYCARPTTHCNDAVIYGKTFGGMMYVCLACDAYVGCHKPQPAVAMGRLANAELRGAKREAHHCFDMLWRRKIEQGFSKSKARKLAYRWLSEETGIPVKFCHIGMFDVAECNKVIEVCKPYKI